MISTDDLTRLHMDLSAGGNLDAVLAEIDALWADKTYKAWHASRSEDVRPFHMEGDWRRLEALGIVRDARLQVRINRIGKRYFVTDVPRLNDRFAAFPYSEEADSLLDYAYQEQLHLWADTIVDMSAGCGHIPLGMETEADRYIYDINARALAYAKLNALINRVPESRVSIAFNNLKRDLPLSLLTVRGQKVVFLFNTPCLPNPAPTSLEAMPINADGGIAGEDLQVRAFEIVAEFKRRFAEKEVKALFLTVSFGRARDGFWALQDKCDRILNARTKWSLASPPPDEPSNGSDSEELFEYLLKSDYMLRKDPLISDSFAQLARSQAAKGLAQIGYGILYYSGA